MVYDLQANTVNWCVHKIPETAHKKRVVLLNAHLWAICGCRSPLTSPAFMTQIAHYMYTLLAEEEEIIFLQRNKHNQTIKSYQLTKQN